MLQIRHTGIYVQDINKMEEFYLKCFDMKAICSKEPDQNRLLDQLLYPRAKILTSKMITKAGEKNGAGDMVELVKVVKDDPEEAAADKKISDIGTMHIAFGVDDIRETADRAVKLGGRQKTDIVQMDNGNYCGFITDPEGNWIELIQRKE